MTRSPRKGLQERAARRARTVVAARPLWPDGHRVWRDGDTLELILLDPDGVEVARSRWLDDIVAAAKGAPS